MNTMAKLIKFVVPLILTASFVHSEKFKFHNYSLYNATPTSKAKLEFLKNLENDQDLDFWSRPVSIGTSVYILVPPHRKILFERGLNKNKIYFKRTINDIQSRIKNEVVPKYTRRNMHSMEWNAYYVLYDIYQWLDDIVYAYPRIASSIIGGSSYEGRQIKGIKISHGKGKRAVFIEGGIHAREWISTATVNYITHQLLTSNNPKIKAASFDFDWYIFPVTNPDGYVWSHESYRLWRKNRRAVGKSIGIDLNRNWDSHWKGEGTSYSNPASDVYAGTRPFSEIETWTLSEFIRGVADQLEMYLSFHNFGQVLLIPYGHTKEHLDNYNHTIKIGRRAMAALAARYGTEYQVGNIAETIYHAYGTSIDWVKATLRVPIVYCYELRDTGEHAFLLPADQILPNCEEVMDSLLALISESRCFGYMNAVSSDSVPFMKILFSALVIRMVQ